MSGATRERLRRGLVVVAASACYMLIGCGDGGGDSTTASAPATTTTTGNPGAVTDGKLTVSVEPRRVSPGGTLQASVANGTDEQFTYGAAYELEHEVDGRFGRVKLPDRPVIEIAYIAEPGETGPPVEVEVPEEATPGTYRVVIARDVPGTGDLSGEFEVARGD